MNHEEKEPQPIRKSDGKGYYNRGPHDPLRDIEGPDFLVPPATDHGTLPNMRFSYDDVRNRLEEGGWAREVTNREIPASDQVAGVDMNLGPGVYREMHWHKEAEWGLMLYGNARVTAIDENGKSFIDDVKAGDIWNFEAGVAHSIQGLDQGCEFLLIFSEPDFSENNTMLITDWLAHTPPEIVAANFKKKVSELQSLPTKEKYIFKAAVPEAIDVVKRPNSNGETPLPLTFHMDSLKPIESEAGRVWIIDQKVFPAAKTISAAIVEVEPGGMRELHWHPKGAEWQYYIQGQARMTVFNSNGLARTFDYRAGDVGYVPTVAGHYVQNTGTEKLIFVEVFKNPDYSDISLNKWMATTPSQIVADHLNLTKEFVESLPQEEAASPVIWFDQDKINQAAAKHISSNPFDQEESDGLNAKDVF
ncbi:cupin domain-containing protein [Enterococcus sp. HY326]|uniref:cupin domain-containing protein n=1 Tax=Enterococcus sp. HY326 TaxID=2971265 RepID=UPI0022405F91|nr:cupin domain-containing protein [Enterococcus sp. HY326]